MSIRDAGAITEYLGQKVSLASHLVLGFVFLSIAIECFSDFTAGVAWSEEQIVTLLLLLPFSFVFLSSCAGGALPRVEKLL